MFTERETLFLRHQIEQRFVYSGYRCPLEITGAGTEIFICCGFSDNVLDKRINVPHNETKFLFDGLVIGSFLSCAAQQCEIDAPASGNKVRTGQAFGVKWWRILQKWGLVHAFAG